MHKKRPKICTHYGVNSTAKIYLYVTSSRPPSGLRSEYNSVQSILVVLACTNSFPLSKYLNTGLIEYKYFIAMWF